jgi:hypothetical protein
MEWEHLIKSLRDNKEHNRHGYWTDGEEILCKTEEQAEVLADFFEDIGFDYVHTGYYDPTEDERNNEVNDHTGYWYVSVD